MKKWTVWLLMVMTLSTAAWAQHSEKEIKKDATQHSEKERKEDVDRHRSIAAAHENAAKCLESGKHEDACFKELRTACKGIAIGKFCGMKHVH